MTEEDKSISPGPLLAIGEPDRRYFIADEMTYFQEFAKGLIDFLKATKLPKMRDMIKLPSEISVANETKKHEVIFNVDPTWNVLVKRCVFNARTELEGGRVNATFDHILDAIEILANKIALSEMTGPNVPAETKEQHIKNLKKLISDAGDRRDWKECDRLDKILAQLEKK